MSVTFNASSSHPHNSTIVGYDWQFGDGATASGMVVSHEFQEPGLYTVSLTVTNAAGGKGERVVTDMIDVNRTIWRHDVDKPIYYSAPAIGLDGTIYVSTGILLQTNFGRVHAIRPDGTPLWTADLDENMPPPDGTARAENNGSSPAIADDGTLYVCIDYALYALDPHDGHELWRQDMRIGNRCATSAVLNRDGIIYIASNDYFYAFYPDGTPYWPEPFVMTLLPEK